jgi:hypothetical protein
MYVFLCLWLAQLAIRRIDSEQYSAWEDMMNDMDLFYSEHEATLNPVGLLERGCLYASQIDGIWARVELIAYTENGDVGLYFYLRNLINITVKVLNYFLAAGGIKTCGLR